MYNPENIARVRRDEAQAKAQEEEEERRMQEVDAERRIQLLRGERLPTPPPARAVSDAPGEARDTGRTDEGGRFKKRRRIAGENDTDRDIRFAQEDAAYALAKREEKEEASRTNDAPLLDQTGHVNLFPAEAEKQKPVKKNAEAEAEKRKAEDQYGMRFSNAAGYKQSASQRPWYAARDVGVGDEMSGKDVWGNEDPMRRERDMARMDANDPLAVMKRGVRQLKSVENGRKKWNEERGRELADLEAADKRQPRRRRHSSVSGGSLDGFRLDGSPERERRGGHRHRDGGHRHRDRSRDRSHRTHHSHSRSHHRDRDRDRHDRRYKSGRPSSRDHIPDDDHRERRIPRH